MSNQYELTGTVSYIGETQAFASGFTKREFVLTTSEKFPQDVSFQVVKDKCDQINFKLADEVTVSFNIRGREYNGRYFVNLEAWRWSVDSQSNIGDDGQSYSDALEQERERKEAARPRGVAASKVASIEEDVDEGEIPF